MSEFPFDGRSGLILLKAEMTGPLKSVVLNVALDTGATTSLVGLDLLRKVGLAPDAGSRRASMVTGSATESVSLVVTTRFSAFGRHRFGFPVVAHSLPTGTAVDGLLGLDFLRAFAITIDFPNGRIVIA